MTELTHSSGWEAINAAVAIARAQVAAAAPDEATAAEGEAYVMRMLTTCLSDAFLGHLMTDSGLTRALPTRGGPNPDYRMSHAGLDPSRRYRLEGKLNDSERVGVGIYSFGAGGSADLSAYAAFEVSSVDAGGRFAVNIAAEATGPGTLPIPPGARVVMIRTLHRDENGEPARLTLHGGPPVGDLGLAQGSTDGALGQVAHGMATHIPTFLEWSAVTSAAVNSFHAEAPPMAQGVQGDPDTIYFLGSYNLAEGEWLEVTMPAGVPGYWSLHAYNYWCESLPGAGVGDNSCVAEPDGSIRIAIGPNAPSDAPNRIGTLGCRRGALICRVIGATSVAVPDAVVRRATVPTEKS
jgi:hypothetical protein